MRRLDEHELSEWWRVRIDRDQAHRAMDKREEAQREEAWLYLLAMVAMVVFALVVQGLKGGAQ